MPDADVRAMRDQLFHTYTATDRVTEFLTQRECNSRMLYTTPEFKIVDVRLEPTCRWLNVYYSIVEHGKVRCREQFPMLWETFRQITADKDVNRVKNPRISIPENPSLIGTSHLLSICWTSNRYCPMVPESPQHAAPSIVKRIPLIFVFIA